LGQCLLLRSLLRSLQWRSRLHFMGSMAWDIWSGIQEGGLRGSRLCREGGLFLGWVLPVRSIWQFGSRPETHKDEILYLPSYRELLRCFRKCVPYPFVKPHIQSIHAPGIFRFPPIPCVFRSFFIFLSQRRSKRFSNTLMRVLSRLISVFIHRVLKVDEVLK